MAWVYLIIAGCCDVVWITSMKYSEGFSKLIPSIATVIGALTSFYLLSLALKQLPVSVTYLTLIGIGGIGTAITGVLLFGEILTLYRIICLVLIFTGIVGLKLQS